MNKFHNIPNELVTDTKGNKHWISPSISVDAMVVVGQHVLVVKRSEAMSNAGLWCLPCGFMDFNETPLLACMRELHEETGVEIRGSDIRNADFDRPHSLNGTALQFVFNLFDFPQVKINTEECTEHKWVNVLELVNYEWAFGHDNLIERLASKL